MKNLANCTPREFFAQSVKIKRSVEEWLDVTNLMDLRKTKPANLIKLDGLSGDEKAKAIEENKRLWKEQTKKNLSTLFDKMLDENAEKTIEVMALCCFVDPADIDNHTMSEFFKAIGELISDEGVTSFFISLVQLGQTDIGIVPKQ